MRTYAGKTAGQRSAERRALLIATGRRLFGTQGYASTSIRAILRESGLQDRYFAESFTGKEDLLGAVYTEIEETVFSRTVKDVDPSARPREQIRRMLENLVAVLSEDKVMARVKFFETAGVSPAIEQLRWRALRRYAEAMAGLLPLPHPSSPVDRSVLAQALVSGVNGMLTDRLIGVLEMDDRLLVEHAMLLVQGVEQQLATPSDGD
ncbi:hypothetical protein C3492_35825 [Streptomyces sp. Ru62]|uniref:TetR/AcrR family transcriptional regulator n=1 Tax=Streptomyces sp. Ru62 TaxID=2080745 RepID=UPI000CDD040D|nr:TetR/AcrR family transcriptional regulator [Streptomyces sp. Ru62]POX58754.1 hypothetical protein C3492_35825 [Streptomyces sp. Ru62]